MLKKVLGLLMLMILFTSVAYGADYHYTMKAGESKTIITEYVDFEYDSDIVNVVGVSGGIKVIGLGSPIDDTIVKVQVEKGVYDNYYFTIQPQFLFATGANAVISNELLPYIKDDELKNYPENTTFDYCEVGCDEYLNINPTYSTETSKYFDVLEEGRTGIGFCDSSDKIWYGYDAKVEEIDPQIKMFLGYSLEDLKDAIEGKEDNYGNVLDVSDSTIRLFVPDDYKSQQGADEVLSKEGTFSLIVLKEPNEGDPTTYIFTVEVKNAIPISEINVYKWWIECIGYTTDLIEEEVYTVNEGADPKAVIIESSNDKVAKVTEEGMIKSTGIGNCTITITSKDDSSISESFTWYTCPLVVVGNKETFSAIMTGLLDNNGNEIGEFNNIISNSNPAILDVEITGDNEITYVGKGEGYATIKIDQYEQPGEYRYITVHCVNSLVSAYENLEVKISKELISNTNCLYGMPFEGSMLYAYVMDQNEEWIQAEIENDTIKFTPNVSGPRYLYVGNEDGEFFVYYIYVKDRIPVVKVSLNTNKLELIKWNKATLKATVLPKKATDKSLTWKSTNEKVATVNSKGVVRGVGEGTAQIICRSVDNPTALDVCDVTVAKVRVNIVPKKVTVRRGKSVKLVANVTPNFDYVNQNVRWISSNPKIATVNQFGVITGIKKGTCKVKAVSLYDGKTYDTIKVGVINK